MKTVALFMVVFLCAVNLAFAQGGSIGIFADATGTSCNLADAAPGLLAYKVVHVNAPGATAAQFSAPKPVCMVGATYLSDTKIFPVTIGGSQTGVAIGYGGCFTSTIHLLTINFFGGGTSAVCCYYPVLPDPALPSGRIEVVDCAENLIAATGGVGIVKANATCQCDVPTQDTTWGKVKSLYTE